MPSQSKPQQPAQQDQASTLRAMFGQAPSQDLGVHLLCCPQRPAAALPLAEMIAKDFSANGHTIALADELSFSVREGWPLKAQVRFDLSHCLANEVPLSACMTNPHQGLWFTYSKNIHALPVLSDRPLLERLANSGQNFVSLLVCAGPDQPQQWDHYGAEKTLTLLCQADQAGSQFVTDWLIYACRMVAIEQVQVVPVIAANQSLAPLHQLVASCQEISGLDCQLLEPANGSLTQDSLAALWAGNPQLITALKNSILS